MFNNLNEYQLSNTESSLMQCSPNKSVKTLANNPHKSVSILQTATDPANIKKKITPPPLINSLQDRTSIFLK